jgi:mono/diheme cytochrome c family protein
MKSAKFRSSKPVARGFSITTGMAFLTILCAVWIGLLLLFVSSAQAQQAGKTPPKPTGNSPDIARGKYLVEKVAMCGQCHTPRDSNGALDQSRALEGAPVILRPANADANWPLTAPRIGGTPPAGDAEMVKLLTTGIWTNGQPLRFPMMPFRMTDGDAKAVVAYLKSLPPHQ